jgi:hypothetical protein
MSTTTTPSEPPEGAESYARLVSAPAIWALHFMLCYVTAAVWCAKVAGPDGSLAGARLAIAAYTVVAFVGIGIAGWVGWERHSFEGATLPHDFDSRGDRHRFLGFAMMLLAGLSAVATLYTALAAVFIGTCA